MLLGHAMKKLFLVLIVFCFTLTVAGQDITKLEHIGPVVSFTLRDKAAAEDFLAKSQLITDATSFGGITTTAERRARWGGDAIPEGFIRLSAGCEDIDDLIEDIAQAL